jgi:hypothetical protein
VTPFEAADAIQSRLTGRRITSEERARFGERFRELQNWDWIADMMSRYKLAGTTFVLDEETDLSGLGAEMMWMTPDQMVDEAYEAYPGLPATKLGYIPLGICVLGSGDPYFLKIKDSLDPALVRIPHDAAAEEDTLQEHRIEPVSPSLSEFLQNAGIE